MNEQEQELVKKYLKYIKKRRIIIILMIIVIFSFLGIGYIYIKNIKELIKYSINENDISNEIVNSTVDLTNQVVYEEVIETKEEKDTSIPIKKEDISVKVQTNNENTSIEKKENIITKPHNKDFLFSDGYNMNNVTEVAREYLKSSGYAGECIPLKDEEGVYIGMRVIFY